MENTKGVPQPGEDTLQEGALGCWLNINMIIFLRCLIPVIGQRLVFIMNEQDIWASLGVSILVASRA